MKLFFFFCSFLFVQSQVIAQPANEDKVMENSLKKSIEFLASDKLEGRRTGTNGEKKAYKMISGEFRKAGLKSPTGLKNYLQPFDVVGDFYLGKGNSLKIGSQKLKINDDYFPSSYSSSASYNGSYNLRMIDVAELKKQEKTNPHFEISTAILEDLNRFQLEKDVFVIIHNDDSGSFKSFDPKGKYTNSTIPVVYFTKEGMNKVMPVHESQMDIIYNCRIDQSLSAGHNVAGFVDNNQPHTVIIGAHYDHLGYGEDHNSLYTGAGKMIHNGADDNASGTAALIELAKWIKKSGLKKYNYLFVAFSGEELGLFGSKYFSDHSPVANETVNYMINMDMVGRLNPTTKSIAIGGYGTSASWEEKIKTTHEYFQIKQDSSGSGPSDHTSFYRKGIPVLFFFTGTHSDYHKPTDDADKVNYEGEVQIINYIKDLLLHYDQKPKLAFLKTREAQMGKSTFKVSLGIFPDYTFSGTGVRVDGVSAGKAAEKAGVQVGDILMKLGDHEFTDVMSYMGALNKFDKGNATKLILKRGENILTLDISF